MVGSSSIEVTFDDCSQTSTSVARPTFTFVPTIPPVTFTPINPGTGTTTTSVAKPVVTLTPKHPTGHPATRHDHHLGPHDHDDHNGTEQRVFRGRSPDRDDQEMRRESRHHRNGDIVRPDNPSPFRR